MKVGGIVLLIIGILMMIFTGFNFTREEKVVDLGPLEINKQEEKHVGWPTYAGGLVAIAGLVLIVAGSKKKG
jgi:hypothetical protein